MASYSEEEVKKALGLPEGISVVAISPIGYPAEEKDREAQKAAEGSIPGTLSGRIKVRG